MTAPVVSWLYVPGDRPDRFAKAAASGAHVVIVDLEDAVAPEHKQRARREALAWLPDAAPGTVEVRVNAADTPWAAVDLAALTGWPALRAVRLPKISTADDVRAALAALADPAVVVTCLLETALGVEHAFAVATADRRVAAIGLGEADLAGDLGVAESGLRWARSRVVTAARAAGLPAPAQSVYAAVSDLTGLYAACRAGRELGLLGRAAVHPRQVPVIHDAFRPDPAEVDAARAVLDALDAARSSGQGVLVLPDGGMVDAAMRRRATDVLALLERLGTS